MIKWLVFFFALSCQPKGEVGVQPSGVGKKQVNVRVAATSWQRGWGPLCGLKKSAGGRYCLTCQVGKLKKKRCIVSQFELEQKSCAHTEFRVKCFIQDGPQVINLSLDRDQDVEFDAAIG